MQPFFYILIRGRNSMPYLVECLESVRHQRYRNFSIIFIDDASEYTHIEKKKIRSLLPEDSVQLWRSERCYSLKNAYEAVHTYCKDVNGVVVSLDADDYLVSSTSLTRLAEVYDQSQSLYTYGNCLVKNPTQQLLINAQADGVHNTKYPTSVIKNRSFRDYHFLPLHLRSWKVSAFKSIHKQSFLAQNGSWLRHCEDMAIFFPLMEMYPNRCAVVDEPLSVYRKNHEGSEVVNNMIEFLRDELYIRGLPKYEQKSI